MTQMPSQEGLLSSRNIRRAGQTAVRTMQVSSLLDAVWSGFSYPSSHKGEDAGPAAGLTPL